MSERREPRPFIGERLWRAHDPQALIDFKLIVKKSNSLSAVRALIFDEGPISPSQRAVLGELNYWCYTDGYEPIVVLIGRPRLQSEHLAFIRATGLPLGQSAL